MKLNLESYRLMMPAFLSATLLVGAHMGYGSPAFCQAAGLPPVNWSKNVHNPGDNQYVPSGEQQNMRHAIPNIPVNPRLIAPAGGGGGGGGGGDAPSWRPTPKAPRPDISLQPIPADEPVPQPGFPPLPDRLDLPGVDMTTAMSFNAPSGSAGGGGGGGGSGGAPPPNPFQGSKEGYSHYAPGAFSNQQRPGMSVPAGGGGGGGDPSFHQSYGHAAPGSYQEPTQGAVGYYKCRTAPHPTRELTSSPMQDTFGSDGSSKPPAYTGASARDLAKLGQEPKLNDRLNGGEGAAPDAPAPVQINQAATQDLSLPDDDFNARKPPNKAAQVMGRQLSRMTNRAFNMVNSMPIPLHFSGGGGGGGGSHGGH